MNADTDTVDRPTVRRAIREYIEANDAPTWSEIAADVAAEIDTETTAVGRELDALEKAGFIYLVPSNDGRVVKLP
jgi:DNA-binding MarR family transcriptional regulator